MLETEIVEVFPAEAVSRPRVVIGGWELEQLAPENHAP